MKNALIAALVTAAAVLVWIALRADEAEPAAVPSVPQATDAEAPAQAVTATETPRAEAPETVARHEVEPARTEPASPLTVTLKGRCVDAATGTPLAGCEVKVHGWNAGSERMGAYLKDHDAVEWEDPAPQTTAKNGTFAFAFVPPPPFQFMLHLGAPQRVPMHGRWRELEPGTVVDVGDVPLASGSRVSGRVDDSSGVTQSEVVVRLDQFNRSHPDRPLVAPVLNHGALSRGDGTFAFPNPVSPGNWNVRVEQRQVVAPQSLEIPDGEELTTLSIETVPVADVETIRGVVVDETGAPLRGVAVDYSPGTRRTRTRADGTFVIERRQRDPDGPVRLAFDREGYELTESDERYPWGSENLRFVLRRGVAMDVVVTDGDTGEPVEDFGVRVFPEPGARGRRTNVDHDLRELGRHPGGRARIEDLRRGPSVLVVEPRGDVFEPSAPVHLEVTDAGAPLQEVEVFRAVSQALRVRHASGEPVAGTSVELLQPLSEIPVTTATYVVERQQIWGTSAADKAVAVSTGRTDERGELTLRGPPRTPLALRVLGPGHQPLCVAGVTLVEGATPTVTVPAGATVVGKIGPPRFLEHVTPAGAAPGPGIRFRRERDGRHETHPANDPVPLDGDGTFRASGVPPGTWDAHLVWSVSHRQGGWSGRFAFLQKLTGLAEGETRELNADLSHFVPGTLSGTVLLDGEALAETTVQLFGRRPGQQHERSEPTVKTGADGTFTTEAPPGSYRLHVYVPGKQRHSLDLPAAESFTLAPGEVVERTFHVRRGALRIRVLRSNGEPAPGVPVGVAKLDATWSATTPPTGDDGWTTLEGGPPGDVALTATPKRLLDPEERRKFFDASQNPPLAMRDVMLQLGRAEIRPGAVPVEIEVRLPAGSHY